MLDTSVLSNFAHVDRLDLLASLPRVVTVAAVERELDAETADTHVKRWIDEAGFRSPARDIDTFLDR